MDYMFLIYSNPVAEWTPERRREATIGHWAVMDEASERGILKGCGPLMAAATAVTVRSANGSPSVTDGPFAETREQLAGYYLITCRDAEEAQYWGRRISVAGCGTNVEIRALAPLPERVAVHA